jgi:hypothetical protein
MDLCTPDKIIRQPDDIGIVPLTTNGKVIMEQKEGK